MFYFFCKTEGFGKTDVLCYALQGLGFAMHHKA
jgi:hypothetical protein